MTSIIPTVQIKSDTCHEGISRSTVIAMSATSLLLIVTLITVILTQCLLILRMRRSIKKEPVEYTKPTTLCMDVPVSLNEAYAVHKCSEEATMRW